MTGEGGGRRRRQAGPPGAGEPLPGRIRQRAEAATGRSLEDVRVHDDARARQWVDELGARGATVGDHVALGSGAGRGLLREAVLAHELAHAAQNRDLAGAVSHAAGGRDAAVERDANRTALTTLLGGTGSVGARPGHLSLRKCDEEPPAKVKEAASKTDPAKLTGFEKMVKGGTPAADASESMQLPQELRDAMAEAWKNSFPGGKSKEQGGILVKKSDGSLDWVKATKSTSGSTTMPWGAVPKGATPLVPGHTHPYDKSEGGHQGVTFSGGDLANLVTDPTSVKVVHAGDRYFVVSKTKEFEATVAAAPDKAKLRNQIKQEWTTRYQAAKGGLPASALEATKAICKKYDLVLYEGKLDGKVEKVDVSK